MAFMKWNESLSVKINSFDEEHKIIIEMINYFYDHINDQSNDKIISNSIQKMKALYAISFHVGRKIYDQI